MAVNIDGPPITHRRETMKPNTRTELERDALSGLLAQDITDKVIGYLASIGWLDRKSASVIYGNIKEKVQEEIDKRIK